MELTFPFLAKLTGATVLAGVITLGTMTTWDGKDTVDTAILKIQEQAGNLGLYETNETKLVEKIDALKTIRSGLQLEVANLTTQNSEKQTQIDNLTAEIEGLDVEIATLESQIVAANTNSETLADRIAALEAQLQTANDDIARLQSELDTQTTTDAPLTESEMATVLETE